MSFYTIYTITLFASGIIAIVLAVYGWNHKRQIGAKQFIGWMGSAVLWALGASFSAISSSPATAQVFTRIAFVGVSLSSVFIFLFVLEYTGRLKWLRSPWLGIYFIVPIITQILHWTPDLRHYFIQAAHYEQIGSYYFLVSIDRAPWFFVHTLYGYGLIFASLSLLIIQAVRSVSPYREQALILLLGGLLPFVANILVITSSGNSLDWTPVAFVFIALIWSTTLFRYRFFDIMPVARDAIVESMDDAVIVIDMQNRILDINPAGQALISLQQTKVIGLPIGEAFPNQASIVDQFIGVQESQMEITIGEAGSRRYFDLRVSPLRRRNEQIGRLIVLRDTTDQVLLIQELNAYAHTVAHDLKTPITVINGYLHVIEMMAKDQLDDTFLEHLHRVRRASGKMTQIIDTLLLFASVRRQSHLDLTTLAMGDIIKEALERLDTVVNNSEADVIVQADTWPMVYGYAEWVEEVWVNYISNAVKYGGTPPHITLGYDEHSEGMIRFWVQDNGQGLSDEEQSRLFMQFSRIAPGKAEGHGLGLSIVLRIVEKLGGEVGMESQIGQGSRFWFTLPTSINAESVEGGGVDG